MEDSYYKALNVLERIQEELLKSGVSGVDLSRKLGVSDTWWNNKYNIVCFPKVNTLLKIAKALNISYEYLLTGCNRNIYKPIEVNMKQLISFYEKGKYHMEKMTPNRINVAIHHLKRGKQKSITCKLLFDFERLLKVSAYKLIVNEC